MHMHIHIHIHTHQSTIIPMAPRTTGQQPAQPFPSPTFPLPGTILSTHTHLDTKGSILSPTKVARVAPVSRENAITMRP